MKILYVVEHKCSIFDIMRVNGLSKAESGSFYDYLTKLEKSRGVYSLVAILKERFRALLSPEASPFRVNGETGDWLKTWCIVSRHARQGRRGLRFMLRLLKLGGLFEAPEPTLEDYLNVSSDISSNPEPLDAIPVYSLGNHALKVAEYLAKEQIGYELQYPLSSSVVPISYRFSSAEVNTPPSSHIEALDNCPVLLSQFYSYFEELVGHSLPSREHYTELAASTRYKHDIVGAITILTGDRGMKKRAVVNPFRLLQLGTSRFAQTLYFTLKSYKTCFVYNQAGGAEWVVQRLVEGVQLTSVDLKSATDNIPLIPQLKLALQLYPWLKSDIHLFGEISRSYWWSPYDGVELKYTRGHGMGLKGSFPLFTLWLLTLCESIVKGKRAYAIVGDDLVIEAAYQEQVLKLLHSYGVPVNEGKSIFCSNVAEFIGRILDKHGNMRVYKASALSLIRDPLGFVRQYGLRAFSKTRLGQYMSNERKERLLTVMKVKRNQAYCKVLGTFARTRRERALLDSDVVNPTFVHGGVPPEFIREWLLPIQRDMAACQYVMLQVRVQQPDIMQGLEVWRFNSPAPIVVRSWLFRDNPTWALLGFNKLVKYIDNLPPEQGLERSLAGVERDFYEQHLSEEIPDVQKSIDDVEAKKQKSPAKIEREYSQSGRTPLAYLLKMFRLMSKLTSRLRASFGKTKNTRR